VRAGEDARLGIDPLHGSPSRHSAKINFAAPLEPTRSNDHFDYIPTRAGAMPNTPNRGRVHDDARAPNSSIETQSSSQAADAAKLHPPPELLDRHGNLNQDFIDNLHFRMFLIQEQHLAALERAAEERPDPIAEAMRKVELYRKMVDLRLAMHKEQQMWSRVKRKRKR
jgi:hypothetical protein